MLAHLKTPCIININIITSSGRNKQDQHPNQNQYYAPQDAINKMLIDLSAIVGLDGVPLHFQLFPKLWLDIYSSRCDNRHVDEKLLSSENKTQGPYKSSSQSRNIERSTLTASIALLVDSHGFLEYVDAVLLDERASLNNQ